MNTERRQGVIHYGVTTIVPETANGYKKEAVTKTTQIGITDAGIPVVFPNGHREIRFDVAAKIPELKNW